jgi:small-conductance mechanosensitive channel
VKDIPLAISAVARRLRVHGASVWLQIVRFTFHHPSMFPASMFLLQSSDSAAAAALAVPPGTMSHRFVMTVILILATVAASALLRWLTGKIFGPRKRDRPRFWTGQFISLAALLTIIVGVLVIWFDDPRRLTGALGLAAAGVAVALQRVITAFAGYVIILRGNLFTIGDRIVMDTVRGDVIGLGFMQTTVMEMGQAAPESSAAPAVWVGGRQYTGRVVRITNDKIFDSPIYNYTREFPYVWEEIKMPIHHTGRRAEAERVLLDVAHRHTDEIAKEAKPALEKLREDYFLPQDVETDPRVYYRLTDNWIEMSVRFLSHEPGVRDLKDKMFREILDGFERENVKIASTSSEVSITSPVRVEGAGLR